MYIEVLHRVLDGFALCHNAIRFELIMLMLIIDLFGLQFYGQNDFGQMMPQVWIFKDESLGQEGVRHVVIPRLDPTSRDVHVLCTGGKSMTNYNVVKTMYEEVAFPWMDDIIGCCTREHQPDVVLVQDSDPDQFKYLMSKGQELADENKRVSADTAICRTLCGLTVQDVIVCFVLLTMRRLDFGVPLRHRLRLILMFRKASRISKQIWKAPRPSLTVVTILKPWRG